MLESVPYFTLCDFVVVAVHSRMFWPFLMDISSSPFLLQESECKAYNPRPFCKTYTMDKQPLNTGEQKDMTEFFTDLITKVEEMSPELVSTRILKNVFEVYIILNFNHQL